ncbi:hypothetical protein [Actinomycetospora sp. TBRC 11914]|uniref:hypothetical protein n=1 Tax=Actinomycetospora sp. TBRC 11914 TaxID=2729387 RepID=UPI0020070E44|nr:hypothetical protein [Actinomycetospora sp. TBRC 11914]
MYAAPPTASDRLGLLPRTVAGPAVDGHTTQVPRHSDLPHVPVIIRADDPSRLATTDGHTTQVPRPSGLPHVPVIMDRRSAGSRGARAGVPVP